MFTITIPIFLLLVICVHNPDKPYYIPSEEPLLSLKTELDVDKLHLYNSDWPDTNNYKYHPLPLLQNGTNTVPVDFPSKTVPDVPEPVYLDEKLPCLSETIGMDPCTELINNNLTPADSGYLCSNPTSPKKAVASTLHNLCPMGLQPPLSPRNLPDIMTDNAHELSQSAKTDDATVNSETRKTVIPLEFSESDYKKLEGKQGLELLTAIEEQTNEKLAAMQKLVKERYPSLTDSSDAESPKKMVRRRSVESGIQASNENMPRSRSNLKRARSYDGDVSNFVFCSPSNKVPKLDCPTSTNKKAESSSPKVHKKEKHGHRKADKDHTSRKHHRKSASDKSSPRKSSSRASVGIQAQLSKHHTKPSVDKPVFLMPSGNFCQPPSEVRHILVAKCAITLKVFFSFSVKVEVPKLLSCRSAL